jgi:glycosyltransferase involved in cell wall biosynthesis
MKEENLKRAAGRIRVLVVTNQWPSPKRPEGGIIVVRQVESVREVGADATVLAIDGRVPSYLRAAGSILAMNFRRRRYDLVHAHTGHSGVLACLQARVPVVCSYVGYDLDRIGEREAPRRRIERLIFRLTSVLIAVPVVKSERARTRLPRRARARAAVLPNGVDREAFHPMERTDARRRLGWGDEPVILFAADPTRWVKRFALAERASAEAKKRVPSARLVVCNGVPRAEVPLWMNAADALLLTSLSEGSPNVVKEAMACNLPVVSVDVGDVAEVVDGARNCHVCPPEPGALSEALVRVLTRATERSDGRERTRHLTERAIAQRLLQIYECALARGPGTFGWLASRGKR